MLSKFGTLKQNCKSDKDIRATLLKYLRQIIESDITDCDKIYPEFPFADPSSNNIETKRLTTPQRVVSLRTKIKLSHSRLC